MPDHQIDRVIRSAQVNHGQLSRVLSKEIPALTAAGIWELIRKAPSRRRLRRIGLAAEAGDLKY